MKKLFLGLLCALLSFSALAQFSGAGSGTSEDPYQITNAEELSEMANFLDYDNQDVYFKQVNDIDLSSWIEENNPVQGWIPIGTSTSPFMGSYDGNGYTINHLYINRPTESNVGLFGYVNGASLKNITIINSNVTGNSYVGGIVGYVSGASTCIGCKHQGELNGYQCVGGIAGYIFSEKEITISQSAHNGIISGSYYLGGIVGDANVRASSYNRYAYIYIIECFATGSIIGAAFSIGGIVGTAEVTSDHGWTSIRDCYAHVDVTGSFNVGGILGFSDNSSVKNCYCQGNIEGVNNVGGIVGYNDGGSVWSNITIVDLISVKSATNNYGRICGNNNKGSIGELGSKTGNRAYSKCEVLVDGDIVAVADDSNNGTGVGLSVLKNANNYIGVGWDFDEVWSINNGLGFPYLRWEGKITGISLDKEQEAMFVDETIALTAILTPSNADASDLEWNSSDNKIATVDNGVVHAISVGSVTITAVSKTNAEVNAVCIVTVNEKEKYSDADSFENIVYIKRFAANQGDILNVPICVKNKIADDILTFYFDLYLPNEIEVILDEDGYPIIDLCREGFASDRHSIEGEIVDGKIAVELKTSRNKPLFGTAGEIATIQLKIKDTAVDGFYDIVLRNITMESKEEGEIFVDQYTLPVAIGDVSYRILDGDVLEIADNASVDKLRFTRNFKNTTWQALYVPFSIPVATLEAHGLKVAELNDTHQYFDANTGALIQTEVEFRYVTSGVTQPNYPYVIKAETAGVVEIELENVQLMATQETEIECSTTRQIFKIKGTYTGISGEEMLQKNYYAMGGGTLVRVAEENPSALKPQRWYMEIVNKDGSAVDYFAPSIRLKIDGIDEESTGISDCVEQSSEAPVYDLQGRQVKAGNLKSGMYVKDHKKIIVL